jgi:hypothetical protein
MSTDTAAMCSACQAHEIDETRRCPHCDYPCAGGVDACAECRSVAAHRAKGVE